MFGGLDTSASLSLGLGEHLMKDAECVAGKPSATSTVAIIYMEDQGFTKTRAAAVAWLTSYRALERKYPRAATFACETIGEVIRFIASGIGGGVRAIGNQIDDAQTAFLQDPNSNDPTHSQLAKDHDDHPLHALAAELASGAVLDVGRTIQRAWAGGATADEVVATAARYFVHPAHISEGWGNAWVLERVRAWVPGHAALIARLGSRSWAVEWTRKKSAELKELVERAERLTKGGR